MSSTFASTACPTKAACTRTRITEKISYFNHGIVVPLKSMQRAMVFKDLLTVNLTS